MITFFFTNLSSNTKNLPKIIFCYMMHVSPKVRTVKNGNTLQTHLPMFFFSLKIIKHLCVFVLFYMGQVLCL